MKKFYTLLFSLALLLLVRPAFAVDTTVVVTTPTMATSFADLLSKPSAWFFYNDETDVIDSSLGSFVNGPSVAPLGAGSAQISVAGTQRRNLATYQFKNIKLSDITTLKFSTYNPSAGNGGSSNRSGYLNFNVSFDGNDTWQKRLVYVPSQNGSVTQNAWKEWDAINGGTALWSWSGFGANGNKWPDNNTTVYRTWNDLISSFSQIRTRNTDSWLGIRVGEPYNDGYTENIDAFKFGTAAGTTSFDFDPYVAPTTPSIFYPLNNAVVMTSNMDKVDWTNSTGSNAPIAYIYEAYSDPAYANLLYQSSPLSISEITTPGTPPGDYYVRVKAQDNVGTNSAWSNDSGNPYHIKVIADITPTPDPFAVPAECALTGFAYGAPIIGTSGNNSINGTPGNDLIFGLGGNDKIDGKGGNDCIVGGDGNDRLTGGTGDDVLLGGIGNDAIDGDSGQDVLYGNANNDSLKGGSDNDKLYGGSGNDALDGDSGDDTLDGELDTDAAKGGSGIDACTAESVKQCEI